jgi:hypothetical protein
MTLEDVAKAYFKVDKEHFGSRYRAFLVDEFTKRELIDAQSFGEWSAHEAALPNLRLPRKTSEKTIDKMLQANLGELGIAPEFGLKLQSVTREERFGRTMVRVQLTEGRGDDAAPLDNHGLLTFRAKGSLADYHSPLPNVGSSLLRLQSQTEAHSMLSQARQLRLNQHDVPLAIVRQAHGQLTVEARVMRSKGFYCWAEVFTLENPNGERREVITPHIPREISGYQRSGIQILTFDDLAQQ